MVEIDFTDLEKVIASAKHRPGAGAKLVVAEAPTPFVPPHLKAESTSALKAEVIFITASAAVGKSTIASRLSAVRHAPLLNLAEVPVSTGSLKSLVSDLEGPTDALAAFHAGQLPIIIDALDEGRLLSGETGFESFMETSADLLLRDRSVTDRPKLVILGRPQSTELAQILMDLHGNGVKTSSLTVAFFGESAARKLIHAYAVDAARSGAAYLRYTDAARSAVGAYFDAIEAALGLGSGELWKDERGRAFAGYAPVLAAIGALLGEIDNFIDVENRLRQTGAGEAWGVIETVLDTILERERKKFSDKLAEHIGEPVPPEAYDATEQLRAIALHVHNLPFTASGRVPLTGQKQAKYFEMVGQYLEEHPFLRQREFANAVLAAVVLAAAVAEDLLGSADRRHLLAAGRQPFLWRSLRRQIKDALIDGSYLGFALNSYWNDPLTNGDRVVMRSMGEGAARLVVHDGVVSEFATEVALPASFYGQLRNVDIEVDGEIKLEGADARGNQVSFYASGQNVVICRSVQIVADVVSVEGQLWLEAENVSSPPNFDVRVKDQARVGWGDKLSARYPWNKHRSTLPPPRRPDVDRLTWFIEECCWRLPHGAPITLYPDYRIPEDDRLKWAARDLPEFPELIKLMIESGLAEPDTMSASGAKKIRVRFNTSWCALRDALRDGTGGGSELAAFIERARTLLNQM